MLGRYPRKGGARVIRAALLLAVALPVFAPPLPRQPLWRTPRPPLEHLVMLEAAAAGIRPEFAARVAWEESRFDPWAVRREGNGSCSTGVFQMNHRACEFVLDPQEQARQGVAYLAYWLKRTRGNEALALRGFRRGHL